LTSRYINPEFQRHVEKVARLFEQLMTVEPRPMRGGSSHSTSGGIYVLYEGEGAVHVGRTRNLRKRLQGHCSESHYHASFAFKRARAETGIKADYRPGNSRVALSNDERFRPVFLKHVGLIRGMRYRFLQVDDPIDQYLLELYAAMELDTSMDEFDTH
jgi:predicted GIY-YIG superfamily endonuclease